MVNRIAVVLFSMLPFTVCAQSWQQRVKYVMDVELNDQTNQYSGTQQLTYYNASPDTIHRVFYHLYFNAFQPGSEMDMYTRSVGDPDPRLMVIQTLSPEEQGYLHVSSLLQDDSPVVPVEEGTILEVPLDHVLLPGDSTVLSLFFSGQVPVMVRRAGRNSKEGIAYSMTQWYPKLCAYDADGWHPDPYVGREFYGDFGDFDVSIRIDSKYTVAGSGFLQDAGHFGYGYGEGPDTRIHKTGETLCWHFIAEDVHDFAWAADPEYRHVHLKRGDGTMLRFFYQETPENAAAWKALPPVMDQAMTIMNTLFGQYPFKTYSFIQGGDGGMEYPMATLVTGDRDFVSLVDVCVHELLHSWYQMVLATNESLYAWMDEGFTQFAESRVMEELEAQGWIPAQEGNEGKRKAYRYYYLLVQSGLEEPLTTHADHFQTNLGYEAATYYKGFIFLQQLEYIVGSDVFGRIMLRYFNTWKFNHPRPLDFIRIAEKESGLVLDWYYEYWILSTKTIDYGIGEVAAAGRRTRVNLQRIGQMPMPVEILVKLKDQTLRRYYVPLDLMRGNKQFADAEKWQVMPYWQWTDLQYVLELPIRSNQIVSIELDPEESTADMNRANNTYNSEN